MALYKCIIISSSNDVVAVSNVANLSEPDDDVSLQLVYAETL